VGVKAEPSLDDLFRQAVEAIDAGDLAALNRQLADHPRLAQERLTKPGRWLRDQVGDALGGFFKAPFLLWFVAEDPVRNRRLPGNIVDITNAIIDAARRTGAKNLQEQLDYALCLVAWSGVAADFGVQLPLIDALIDAGAAPALNANNALVNSHIAAAERILERGGEVTLASALCLGRWERCGTSCKGSDRRATTVRVHPRGTHRPRRRRSTGPRSRGRDQPADQGALFTRDGAASCGLLRLSGHREGAGRRGGRHPSQRQGVRWDASRVGQALSGRGS
jgi:hypothetical protein